MVQTNNTPINLRVKFKKIGRFQFISHLDLVRTMTRIAIRSGLPLYYTEGFNPIPKLVFAAPLSIGTESFCEYLDIRLTEKVSEQDALCALNECIGETDGEFCITEAYYPETKLTDLKWFSYTIEIETNGFEPSLADRCVEVLLADKVTVEKKTKSGNMSLVDIRPLIKSVDSYYKDNIFFLNCVLSADQSAFLNPELVVKSLKSSCGILSDPCIVNEGYTIVRMHAYKDDMSEFR